MHHILLDTNIVIYLLNKNEKIISFLEKFSDTVFSISIVTWIEVLAGSHNHDKSIPQLAHELARFFHIPVHTPIGLEAVRLLQTDILRGKKKQFQDSLIAATAISHKIPLITNNPKDFDKFKGLKIISPK